MDIIRIIDALEKEFANSKNFLWSKKTLVNMDKCALLIAEIKANLISQLTASVRWTQTVKNMINDGASEFTECGPGAVLQGLIKKIDKEANAHGIA